MLSDIVPIAAVLFFTASSKKIVIWFMIIVVIVAMIDANVISPRIAKSMGISSFWVIFALVLGGSLFRNFRILLSVPFLF